MDPTRIVVDTSILFASLIRRQTKLRQVLLTPSDQRFYSPRFVMVEIFKHKQRIAAATELSEDELLECLSAHLSRIVFIDEGVIPIGTWMEGRRLCAESFLGHPSAKNFDPRTDKIGIRGEIVTNKEN